MWLIARGERTPRMPRHLRCRVLAVAVVLPLALHACAAPAPDPSATKPSAPTWREPITGMRFVYISPGTFHMGSPPGEPLRETSEVLHTVRVERGFYLGRTEVTQAQWTSVMGWNPSWHQDCGLDCPVEMVARHEVDLFLALLNASSADSHYRLPTEAEWEYACRAGTRTPFSTGDSLSTEQANYDGDFPLPGQAPGIDRGSPAPVASFAPNPWGLYDMHGNVWEHCADRFGPYRDAPDRTDSADRYAPADAELRVIRGGSWAFGADSARCALRYHHAPVDRGSSLGFRVVREAQPERSDASATPPILCQPFDKIRAP